MILPFARMVRALVVFLIVLCVAPLRAADTRIPAGGPGKAAIASAYPLAS